MKRRRLQWVRVVGPSMTPTVRDGDLLLVRRGARIRPGDVVLAVFETLPGRFVVKRAAYEVDGRWWLTSDNRFVEGDSASHGVASVHGRAVLRLAPHSPFPRWVR